MTVAEFNKYGKQISDTEILAGDFLYNNAACKVDRRFDLLFPTYYNTHGGTTDTCWFRCYLAESGQHAYDLRLHGFRDCQCRHDGA
jgi:hypothetical protein